MQVEPVSDISKPDQEAGKPDNSTFPSVLSRIMELTLLSGILFLGVVSILLYFGDLLQF